MFTNAILHISDITALIRDTVAHESALFSLAPSSEILGTSDHKQERNANERYRNPARNTAVAAILGGDMAERLRREKAGESRSSRRATVGPKEDVDVDLLLKGAEKLCAVYPVQGALDRIAILRNRHYKVKTSLGHYESLVAEQANQLRQMSRPSSRMSDFADNDDVQGSTDSAAKGNVPISSEDWQREEASVKELEQKKAILEERVSGMEKDLGGILR